MTYFKDKELECPYTRKVKLHPGFLKELNLLRKELNFAMVVNSCCRSKEYNNIINGHPRSLHVYDEPFHPILGCMAVDISTKNLKPRQEIALIAKAYDNKWSVGLAKTFIHIDLRVDIGMPQVYYKY